MDRPKMDKPREIKGTPFSREVKRLLKAGLLITGIVLAVGSLPVVLLWLWAGDLEEPGPASLGYRDEEVRLQSGEIGLVGRLRMPAFEGPHPAMVIAHGSGRSARGSYEQLSQDLALNGFGLLTYDKRGVGESGGTYTGVGPSNSEEVFGLLSDDIVAGIEFLKQHPDVRADRIGVLGISQGGWIAPVVASKSRDVAYLVIISGPTVTVGEEIYYSDLTGEVEGRSLNLSDEELSQRLVEYTGPRGFDPMPVLQSTQVPGLWVLGDEDRSIPIPETVAGLDELILLGKPFSRELLPGVGHGMRDVHTGERAPVFPIIFQWLVANVAPPR